MRSSTIVSKRAREALIQRIETRAHMNGAVSGPCIKGYMSQFQDQQYEPIELLGNLTRWFVGRRDETESLIRAEMERRWVDEPHRIPGSIANSLRRSAGTNYQGLVSYALSRYLNEVDSAWYLQHPVSREFREALSIVFGAGIQPDQDIEGPTESDNESNVGITTDQSVVRVQPDVDILIRNSAWQSESDPAEPVLLLSVKTSLVDRAGMAARWKMYFDLVTNPCPHSCLEGCAYDGLGIRMENSNRYDITHGIVTANIYKYWFHDERYRVGELNSGQTRSNTYMFSLKLTTRDDGIAVTPPDWNQFPHIANVLKNLSEEHNLPI